MTQTFLETFAFTRRMNEYFADDEEYRQFQNFLMEEPTRGDVIRDTGNVRKVRWSDSRRGKGKRGGLRVLYVYVPEVSAILLVTAYNKNEKDDLTPQQRRQMRSVAEELRADALASQGRKET